MSEISGVEIPERLLVLDAATPTVYAGIVSGGALVAKAESSAESLEGIFLTVEQVCEDAGFAVLDCGGFAYCEGPGSVLGLRLAVMAVAVWLQLPGGRGKPVFSYRSTSLVGMSCLAAGQAAPFWVTADYREGVVIAQGVSVGAWEGGCLRLPEPVLCGSEALELGSDAEGAGAVWRLPQRKLWKKVAPVGRVIDPYPFAEIGQFARLLFRRVSVPEVWQIAETDYARWKGDRHR